MDRESLKTVFFMALVGLLLAACSPRVITEVTKNYPARSVDDSRQIAATTVCWDLPRNARQRTAATAFY